MPGYVQREVGPRQWSPLVLSGTKLQPWVVSSYMLEQSYSSGYSLQASLPSAQNKLDMSGYSTEQLSANLDQRGESSGAVVALASSTSVTADWVVAKILTECARRVSGSSTVRMWWWPGGGNRSR
jgi:hypothetical protein